LITAGDSYRANTAIRNIAQGETLGISNLIIISIVIIALTGFIMQKTSFGRKMQFVGANITASAFSGIRTRLYTFLAFFMSGLIAGLTGVLQFSKLTSATINIGDGWLFNAMTIAVFSSVIFGRFKAHGIMLVAILITMMTTGINMLGVSSAWTNFVLGFILLLSLAAGKYINFDFKRRQNDGRKETV
jgi:ribose/xylose/arabinose/galactoside ABC-type transport system permease subunit